MFKFHKKSIRLLSTISIATTHFTSFSDTSRIIEQSCRMGTSY